MGSTFGAPNVQTRKGIVIVKRVAMIGAMSVVLLCVTCENRPGPVPATVPAQTHPTPPGVAEKGRPGFLSVRGNTFVDSEGRQVLLRGMAVIGKDPKENYQSWHGPEDFARMRVWGLNCIRLGIVWDGLEPRPLRRRERSNGAASGALVPPRALRAWPG